MKRLMIITVFALLAIGCTSTRQFTDVNASAPEMSQDSLEYEIWITDIGFDTWFMLNYSPSQDRSNEYYRSWNNRYVIEWNYKYTSGHYGIDSEIVNYDPTIDYGIEVNRKLYYYFRFVEEELRIPILDYRYRHRI
ncbi:hypothetical protein EYV94_12260 [Puteibacter caeruleilacunae]|nr:hypothetical protein EYV94_12260 [Puteibacter caeruleilacunae]